MERSFTIKVGKENYNVISISDGETRRYRIDTGCNYLFTIHETEFGGWLIDDLELVPITEALPYEIGHEINQYEKLADLGSLS